jgi:phosphoribosylanthranilate isomerase
MTSPTIQVAGIRSLAEAKMLARSGVTHLGFPFGLDHHAEDTTPGEAADIISQLPTGIRPVLITYLAKAGEIHNLMNTLGCTIVQLHGAVPVDEIIGLRYLFPKVEIWKSLVIHPENPEEVFHLLHELDPVADAFITDTFNPETGASGATGKTHDWQVSRRIVMMAKKPVILAGGLNPDNVYYAVIQTCPAGVDVHTGVEDDNGFKRKDLVELFVKNALRAFGEIDQKRKTEPPGLS